MAECDDTVQVDLVQVRRLQLEHGRDRRVRQPVTDRPQLRCAVEVSEASTQQVGAVLVEEVEDLRIAHDRDLDQLGHAVADLILGKCCEEGEVEEHPLGSMVSAEPILVLAVVDGHLDRHAGVDQPDQRRGDPDVGRVAPVTGAGEPGDVGGEPTADDQNGFGATQPERVELTDDPLERRQRLRGLPDLHRHHGQRDAVVAEVAVDLLPIETVNSLVDHHQRATVVAVAVREVGVAELEDAVDVHQVVVDAFVSFDAKGPVGGGDSGFQFTHRTDRSVTANEIT